MVAPSSAMLPLLPLFLHLATVADAAAVGRRADLIGSKNHNETAELPLGDLHQYKARAADPWSGFTQFSWTPWTKWGFQGHSVEYAKQWYYAAYGLNPPSGSSWPEVSQWVIYYGTASPAIAPCKTAYSAGGEAPYETFAPTCVAAAASSSTSSSSAAASSSTSSSAARSSSASTSTSSAAASTSTSRATGDFQTFNSGLGGVFAPSVTQSSSSSYWFSNNQQYNSLQEALSGSCSYQSNQCANAANSGGNKAFTVSDCQGSQQSACNSNAGSAAAAYSSQAATWSTSKASANYAAATQARSSSNDLQSFTGALGGYIAPPVTASGSKWVSSGQTYNFLTEALQGSCYYQMNQCQQAANAGGNKLELTVDNCNNRQIQACLSNAQNVGNNQAAAPSSTSSPVNTASASAYSYSSSASAYSSSSNAAAAAQSASAYSFSSSYSANQRSSSASPSASPTASASTTTNGRAAGDYQTFTGAAGGAAAPPVLASGTKFTQSGNTYDRIDDALSASCWAQSSLCGSSSANFDKNVCWGSQVQACLNAATTAAQAYSSGAAQRASSAAQYSSSVASANFAAATVTRQAGDLQTFTGALGGIAAPSVGGTLNQWTVAGYSGTFWGLYDALAQSCWKQQELAQAKGEQTNWPMEFSRDNLFNVQTPNCLANARKVADNWSPSSSAPAAANTASAASWSASWSASSLAAYSASSAANAAQQSAVAWSASSQAAAASAAQFSATSLAAYSASSAANAAQQSAVAWSASSQAAAASAAQFSATSLAAYSASSAANAASQSAVAWSASSQAAAASAAQFSATSLAAYSASSAAAAQSAVAWSASSAASAAAASASAAAAAAVAIPDGWLAASPACVAEGTSGRALVGASTASQDMTWKKCTDFCQSKGFAIAGLEYSGECFCGATLANGASLSRSSDACNMKCSGAPNAICGGPGALTLFVSAAARNAGKLSADLTSLKVDLPEGWKSSTGNNGICVQEGTTGRALAGNFLWDSQMTYAKCLSFCKSKGQRYAGIEYGSECYCGNDIVNGASLDRTGPCSMTCSGDPGSICGAGNLLTVFEDSSLLYTLTNLNGFSKQGCIQEVGGRALTGATSFAQDMTLDKCTDFCKKGGFAFAGLEYSSECYCGNSLVNGASLGTFSTQCSMPCSGNAGQVCGGPNAISLYSTLTGNALVGA